MKFRKGDAVRIRDDRGFEGIVDYVGRKRITVKIGHRMTIRVEPDQLVEIRGLPHWLDPERRVSA